jgi:hypothetical protein
LGFTKVYFDDNHTGTAELNGVLCDIELSQKYGDLTKTMIVDHGIKCQTSQSLYNALCDLQRGEFPNDIASELTETDGPEELCTYFENSP